MIRLGVNDKLTKEQKLKQKSVLVKLFGKKKAVKKRKPKKSKSNKRLINKFDSSTISKFYKNAYR